MFSSDEPESFLFKFLNIFVYLSKNEKMNAQQMYAQMEKHFDPRELLCPGTIAQCLVKKGIRYSNEEAQVEGKRYHGVNKKNHLKNSFSKPLDH